MAITVPDLSAVVNLTSKVASMQVPAYWNVDITIIGAVKSDAVQVVSALRAHVPMKLTITAFGIEDTRNPNNIRGIIRGLVIVTDKLALGSTTINHLISSLSTVRAYIKTTFRSEESLFVNLDGSDFFKSAPTLKG